MSLGYDYEVSISCGGMIDSYGWSHTRGFIQGVFIGCGGHFVNIMESGVKECSKGKTVMIFKIRADEKLLDAFIDALEFSFKKGVSYTHVY